MILEKAAAPSQSPGMKTRVGLDIVDENVDGGSRSDELSE